MSILLLLCIHVFHFFYNIDILSRAPSLRAKFLPSVFKSGNKSNSTSYSHWNNLITEELAWIRILNTTLLGFSLSFYILKNLMDIIGKQQRGKYYASLKAGKYSRLCKTPAALESEKEKQSERLYSISTLVDRMTSEYPELQTSFQDIFVALRSHDEGGVELDRSVSSSTRQVDVA